MKAPVLILCILSPCRMLTAQQPAATPPAAPPVIRTISGLDGCPEAVRAAFKKHAPDAIVSEIRQITEEKGSVTYSFETGGEEDGADEETSWYFDTQGRLIRKEEDVPLKSAPAVVREALLKLAGTTAVVDDVERVTEGAKVTWKAELESNGGADRKALLAADGSLLTLTEEDDD